MILMSLAPSERLASTNSFSRSESVKPRTMRAMYGQVKSTMIAITSESPGWIEMGPITQPSLLELHAATMPIEISSCGMREHHVPGAREERVGGAAEVAGGQPDHEADEDGDERGDDADDERRPGAVHRADEQVATLAVDAEHELRVRAPSGRRRSRAASRW